MKKAVQESITGNVNFENSNCTDTTNLNAAATPANAKNDLNDDNSTDPVNCILVTVSHNSNNEVQKNTHSSDVEKHTNSTNRGNNERTTKRPST